MVPERKVVCSLSNFFKIWLIAGIVVSFSLGAWSYTYAGDTKISRQSIDLLTKIDQATAEIVEAVRPSVVNISTTRTVKMQGNVNPFFEDPFFKKFFGDQIVSRCRISTGKCQ